jgi:AcrR family transcriptional regulator
VTTRPAGQRRTGPSRQRLGEDERRAQIIRAAVAAVARHGYDGATAATIAGQAGVSKGLIWHYFRDKDDLMRQAVTATVAAIRDAAVAELDLSAPVTEVIRAAIRRAAWLSRTRQDELAALNQITRALREPDGTPAFSLSDYEDLYQGQEALFRRGQAEGSLRPFDTRVMAVTYQGAIDMMLAYIDSHPGTDIDQYADALADILLAGIGNRA